MDLATKKPEKLESGLDGLWTGLYMKKIQRCLEAGHFSQDGYEESVESSSVLHGAVLT